MFFQASELLTFSILALCLIYFCIKHKSKTKREWLNTAEQNLMSASELALGIYAGLFCIVTFVRGIIQFLCYNTEFCQSVYAGSFVPFPEMSTTLLLVIGLGSLRLINKNIDLMHAKGT